MTRSAIWKLLVVLPSIPAFAQTGSEVKIDTPQARAIYAVEPPHQPTPMHEHKFNRVMIFLDSGEMIETSSSGRKETFKFRAGEVRWSPAAGPHASEFIAGHPVRLVEVEIKGTPKPAPPPSPLDPLHVDARHYSLVFENDQVRVLRVRFGAHEKGVPHEHTLNHIVVYLTDQARGPVGTVKLEEPMTHSEENPLDHEVERIAIDLK